jgi:Lar family restriction alleviation protein
MSDLLPCPFCGGEAEIERVGTPRQSTIYACTECGCRLETGEEWGHGTQWNTRAPSVGGVGAVELLSALQAAHRAPRGKRWLPELAEDRKAIRRIQNSPELLGAILADLSPSKTGGQG